MAERGSFLPHMRARECRTESEASPLARGYKVSVAIVIARGPRLVRRDLCG